MENTLNEDRIREIFQEELLKTLGDYSKIPLEVDNALIARGFSKLTAGVVGPATVFVALSSGGSPTSAITFRNGVRIT